MSGPDCRAALDKLYQFLDRELADADADTIRAHLDACEPCLEEFGVEEHIRALVKRCCGASRAPETLRVRITAVSTTTIVHKQP